MASYVRGEVDEVSITILKKGKRGLEEEDSATDFADLLSFMSETFISSSILSRIHHVAFLQSALH